MNDSAAASGTSSTSLPCAYEPGALDNAVEIIRLGDEALPASEAIYQVSTEDWLHHTAAADSPLHPYDHCDLDNDMDILLHEVSTGTMSSSPDTLSALAYEHVLPTGLPFKLDASLAFTEALVHMNTLAKGDLAKAYRRLRNDDPTWYKDTRAHLDGGSMATTTDNPEIVWHQQPISKAPLLKVADKKAHRPTHRGYLCLPTETGTRLVPTYLTPTLPATIVSPSAACGALDCEGYVATSNFNGRDCSIHLRHCKQTTQDVKFPATLHRGLLYSRPLIRPTAAQRTSWRPPPSLPGCLGRPSSAPSSPMTTHEVEEGSTAASPYSISEVEEGPCVCPCAPAPSAPEIQVCSLCNQIGRAHV